MFTLEGTEGQRAVAAAGLARSTFPWDRLAPGLKAATGRTSIPVDWADLSRYAQQAAESHHAHVHGPDGDTGHLLATRERTLGLAWYSGRVTLDASLEAEPELAAEVLLAEGAHMVDFFLIDAGQREALFAILHGGKVEPHGHGWFEETGDTNYWAWVGEAWMGLFILAYSDVVPTLGGFVHKAEPAMVPAVRRLVTPPSDPLPYFATAGSTVFHDAHRGRRRDVEFATYAEAVASGRRPCGVCKPKP